MNKQCRAEANLIYQQSRLCLQEEESFNNTPCNHTDTVKLIIIIKAPEADPLNNTVCVYVCLTRDGIHQHQAHVRRTETQES